MMILLHFVFIFFELSRCELKSPNIYTFSCSGILLSSTVIYVNFAGMNFCGKQIFNDFGFLLNSHKNNFNSYFFS